MGRAGAGGGGHSVSGGSHGHSHSGGSHHMSSPSTGGIRSHSGPSLGEMVAHEVKREVAREVAHDIIRGSKPKMPPPPRHPIAPPPPPPPRAVIHVDVPIPWKHPRGGWRRPIPFGLRLAELTYDRKYFDELLYVLEKVAHHDKIHRDEGDMLDRTFNRKITPPEAKELVDWVRYERDYL